MNKYIPLSKACKYSSEKIKLDELTLGSYITTDNILQNKQGVKIATNLPPQGNSFPKYNAGNILVGNIRPYLKKIWYADNDGGCSADVLVFDVKKGFYPEFVYYTMFQDDFFIHTMKGSKGTKMPRGDKNQIMEYQIPDIDFNSQKQIASVLSALDSKIALNNRINAELEAMAKTVYDYWFVQFDFPFDFAQGKPSAEGKPYKSSGGKMVWSEELKREVPEGWEVKNLGEVATIKAGGDKPAVISSEKTNECPIPIYSNGIVNNGLYGYTNKAIINSQSITISARGTIGFCVLRNNPYVPIIRLISLTPNCIGSTKYFYEALKNFNFENSGSVQQQLTVPQVQNIKILYPNENVLINFDKITSPMINKMEMIAEENQQLTSLRDWLLPMLMNGQVKVGGETTLSKSG